jgi:hypothetical protein
MNKMRKKFIEYIESSGGKIKNMSSTISNEKYTDKKDK